MATVLVSGAIANKPNNGGEAWVRLSWVLGLRRLGVRVLFVEQIAAGACVDRSGSVTSFENSVNRGYFQEVISRFGLDGAAALLYEDGTRGEGLPLSEVLEIAANADLLVNISGHLRLEAVLRRVRRTAYIDIDPGFTQFWHEDDQVPFRLPDHDFYFTIGENIGTPSCPIPTSGISWRPIRQPVVLDHWPVAAGGDPSRFTTVSSWRGPYGPIQQGDRTYGLKHHEFRKLIELPRRGSQLFEIAMKIDPADGKDLELLRANGWRITDPTAAAGSPDLFRRWVQDSGAEFSPAQGVYVETRSGWFSDRTVRYLASGKPALVQDTGFGRRIPSGEGLVAFRTLEEAAAGAAYITRDYERHCRAARALAETYFDSDRVLGRMLEETGVTA